MSDPTPSTGDHYRVTDPGDGTDSGDGSDPPVPPGTYRVVGTGESVALLQVGDADGARVHTGRVEHLDPGALSTLDPAPAPDEGVVAAVEDGFRSLSHLVLRVLGR